MPEVKIILTDSYFDDETLVAIARQSITDWEEISDEDLLYLQNHKHRILWSPHGFEPTILIKDPKPIADHIGSIKSLIAEEQLKEHNRAQALKEKAAEKAAKAKQRQLKKLSNMIKDNPQILDEISAIK